MGALLVSHLSIKDLPVVALGQVLNAPNTYLLHGGWKHINLPVLMHSTQFTETLHRPLLDSQL
jgi:hypothetical protein